MTQGSSELIGGFPDFASVSDGSKCFIYLAQCHILSTLLNTRLFKKCKT